MTSSQTAVDPAAGPRLAVDGREIEMDPQAAALLGTAGRHAVADVAQWARDHAGEFGVRLQRVKVTYWRSPEDAHSQDVFVDVIVDGSPDAAIELGRAASAYLGTRTLGHPFPGGDLLAVAVHWR